MRVYRNALRIAETEPEADRFIVSLGALLHDADDAKLFHTENNENASRFLESKGITGKTHSSSVEEEDAEMIKIFDLGYVTSDEEITTLKKAEGAKRKKVNQVVLPKVVLPDIHVHLIEMSQIAYNQFRNADPMQREYLAADFAKEMRDITTSFILMAKGEIECTEGLAQIKSGLVKIEVMLKLAMELKIWKLDACVRFSDLLVDANNLVGKEIEKSAAKNKK